MTEWIRQRSPIKEANIKKNSAAWKILSDAGIVGQNKAETETAENGSEMEGVEQSAPSSAVADTKPADATATNGKDEGVPSEMELRKTLIFDENLARLARRRGEQKYVRYQMNPRENWGPLSKASSR
jgi:tRNA (guanine26-N2/guanine27-N2)-dimethyltransferase